MSIVGLFKKYSLTANLLLAVIIFSVLVLGVMSWLNHYTHHGKVVEIPNVKGLRIEDVASVFQNRELKFAVVDSMFIKNVAPGTIIETSPPIGTFVKRQRTIYLTINSLSSHLLTIPDVIDMSRNHAASLLKSVGFTNVEEKLAPGAFRDLVIGLENRGKTLSAGDKVLINTQLTLLVSSGTEDVSSGDESETLDSEEEEEAWN